MASKANIGQISPVFEVLNGFNMDRPFFVANFGDFGDVNFCSDFE